MAELHTTTITYDGPELEGYRSEVDEEDLEHILIASREHIYSHPIQTLVQEYVNNGKDANRSAGKPDHAIDITIPTYDNLEFVCRDYGVGLSKEEIIAVYRKIGKSTKRTNNKLAGKYGVGAKIGFVYADAFLITSWKDGRKVECLAHKANSQIGDYTFLSDVESDEPNGVQISIKLTEAAHITQFRQAVQRMFYLWPEKPNFNIGIEWPKIEYEDECVKMFSTTTNSAFKHYINEHNLWLNVDGTPYKVSSSVIDRCGVDLRFYYTSIYLNASLSDVDIPMNREELTANNKLDSFIRNSFQKLEKAKNSLLERLLSKEDFTDLEALEEYIDYNKKYFRIKKVEVFAKEIDRKVTYEDGFFYLEPKGTDTFTHYFSNLDHRGDPTKITTNNMLLPIEPLKPHPTKKMYKELNRHSDTSAYSIWVAPDGLPENIKKFCMVKDYAVMFPKVVRSYMKNPRVANDIVYYDKWMNRNSSRKDNFTKRYDITKPLYYSLFDNGYHRNSVLTKYGVLYSYDLDMDIIGVIPRNLKTLKAWGYNLIPLNENINEYKFSSKVYVDLKRSMLQSKTSSDFIYKLLRNVPSKLDIDINYIRRCSKEGHRASGTLKWNDTYIPNQLKEFIDTESKKVDDAIKRIKDRYPFMEHMNWYKAHGVSDWISSYLIPLLLSNPRVEQSKLVETTTDLN